MFFRVLIQNLAAALMFSDLKLYTCAGAKEIGATTVLSRKRCTELLLELKFHDYKA